MANDTDFFRRPRNAQTTLYFALVSWSATDPGDNFADGPPTFAAGDVKVSKDGAAYANATNLPTHLGQGTFTLVLTATEMQAGIVLVTLRDTAVKVWKDRLLTIETAEPFNGILQSGTAQAGAATTVTLSAEAVATDDYYNGARVTIVGGTGVGQSRVIRDYVGASKVATVSEAWVTNPGATSIYVVTPGGRGELTSAAVDDVWDEQEGAEPTGATPNDATMRSILQRIKRAFFNRGTATNSARSHYKDDSLTVRESQTFSSDGTTQDLGKSV